MTEHPGKVAIDHMVKQIRCAGHSYHGDGEAFDPVLHCNAAAMIEKLAAYLAELEARLGAIEHIAQEAADTAGKLHEEAHHG